jgi:putative flippase GtrA
MEEVEKLNERYGVFKAAEFGIAGAVGFLVAEGVTLLGLFAIYGKVTVPSNVSSSPVLLGLDVFAFVLGVTVGFFVNELTTVRKSLSRGNRGARGTLSRLARFQGVYALGNAITIGVQLALLAELSLTPALGNIVGAVAAYPVSYYLSMRVVWKS